MATLQLHRLITSYSTNPSQPPIPVNDTVGVLEGIATPVDVTSNDNCLLGRTKTVISVNSPVNCTASVSDGIVTVTGASVGVGGFNYVVSDGSTSASGSVTLNISSGLESVVVTDATLTDFGNEVSNGDTVFYTELTTNGATVSIDALGQVTVIGTYTIGDTFTYRVNSGANQTFTFL